MLDGEVTVTRKGHDGELARRRAGDYFGESALRHPDILNIASVRADESSGCTLGRISRANFAARFPRLFSGAEANL